MKMQTLMNLKERAQWIIGYVAEKNNLSNAKIGSAVGSKPDTIRKYRSGIAVPRLNFIQRFCDCFGVDFKWLSEGKGEPFPGQDILPDEAPDVIRSESEESLVQEMASPPKTEHADSGAVEGILSGAGGGSEHSPFSTSTGMDCEMSFQKLAVLCGIRIDTEWIFNLSKKIGIESWKIGMSIYHQRIENELIQRIEDCGYKRHGWLVERKAGNAAPANGNGDLSISELLKITEEVLRSDTIHSMSLSLNILSLKVLADQSVSAPVMGTKAVIFPRKNANHFI